jgi:HAD superfamily hydrolase (TIGR01509 family)
VIRWSEVETLFLDVGNTLVSIDFQRVAGEIESCGFRCDPAELRRAEAAARPALSRWLGGVRSTEAPDSFHRYVSLVLERLPAVARSGAVRALAVELVPRLRSPGRADRLWRFVLPGVPEALASLRAAGLRLVAVSNSDGSAERGLVEAGLRPHFDHVVDSALVGYEKPDPRIFERALSVSGAARQRVVHVGDLYHADVLGARAAGIGAVLLDPFGDWRDVDCECARDLPEIASRFLDPGVRHRR